MDTIQHPAEHEEDVEEEAAVCEDFHLEQSLPFALSVHEDRARSKGLFPFSDAAPSAAYTSCSESIGDSSYLRDESYATSQVLDTRTPPRGVVAGTTSEKIGSIGQQDTTNSLHVSAKSSSPAQPLNNLGTSEASLLSYASSHLPHSELLVDPAPHLHQQGGLVGSGSLDFSQLMARADDTVPTTTTTRAGHSYLPPLVEESQEPVSPSSSSGMMQNEQSAILHHHQDGWYDTLNTWVNPFGPPKNPQSVMTRSMSQSVLEMGSTVTMSDGVEATRIDSNNVEVRVHLKESAGSVEDVMDVIGNPELLRLWCDPITAVIVTNASDGAGTFKHCPEQDRGRMYDGEWIEATTNLLVAPTSRLHYLYTMGNIFWSTLGFPSYGKVTLFVERQRGQVGMTLKNFPGGMSAYHTFVVRQDVEGVLLINKVETKYEGQEEDSSCSCSGLLEPLEQWFSFGNDGYLEQVVSSMRRLRTLVEEGGEIGAYVIAPGMMGDSAEHAESTTRTPIVNSPEQADDSAWTPLLG